MLTSIKFTNFKALSDFSISLKDFNVLTGPNNNGKSTIIDGLRLLQRGYRYVSRLTPRFIKNSYGLDSWGFEIPPSTLQLNLGILQTNLNTGNPSIIKYSLGSTKSLTLILHPDSPVLFLFDTDGKTPKKASDFRKEFPINISIIPTLGPFEIEEQLRDADYVKAAYGGRRSPRMFRSFWYYNPDKFDEFKSLVEKTWEGMSISSPEKPDRFGKDLVMFCEEDRMTREICWSGFGFQIWLQLLTHIVNYKNSDLIVVDEPEIYLHPDLQHKVIELLKEYDSRILIATHSVEIINTVEPNNVILIDKKNKTAKRISDLAGLQNVSNILGSGQNIELTKLARGKKILFVEGKDVRLLNKLAKACKRDFIFNDAIITTISLDGFSQHERIIHTNWAFSKVLGEEIKIAVLLDRDYRTNEEVETVLKKLEDNVHCAHIFKRKEIENYLLIPSAINIAVNDRFKDRINTGTLSSTPVFHVSDVLLKLTDELKSDVLGQIVGNKIKPLINKGFDISTIFSQTNIEFEESWKSLDFRLKTIPGKRFISVLNEYLSKHFKITITTSQLIQNIHFRDVDDDLLMFFDKLANFKSQ